MTLSKDRNKIKKCCRSYSNCTIVVKGRKHKLECVGSDAAKIDDILGGFLKVHNSTRKLASLSNSWPIEEKNL